MQPINIKIKVPELSLQIGQTSQSERSYQEFTNMLLSDRGHHRSGFSFNLQQAKTLTNFQQQKFLQINSKLNLLSSKDLQCQRMVSKLDNHQDSLRATRLRVENDNFIRGIKQEQEEENIRLKQQTRFLRRDKTETTRRRIKTVKQFHRQNSILVQQEERQQMHQDYYDLVQNHNNQIELTKTISNHNKRAQKLDNIRLNYKRHQMSQHRLQAETDKTCSQTNGFKSKISFWEVREHLARQKVQNSQHQYSQSIHEQKDVKAVSAMALHQKFSSPQNPYIIIRSQIQQKSTSTNHDNVPDRVKGYVDIVF